MKTMGLGWVALSALLISACDDPQAMPTPKNAETPTTAAMTPVPPTPPPTPLTDIPATSTNPDAVAAYRVAVDLMINGHPREEMLAQLKKANELDPTFVTANAFLAYLKTGAEGDTMIANAIANARGLPESEMLYLQTLQASHLGDSNKNAELWKKLAGLLPGAARAQYMYAGTLNGLGDFDNAKVAYRKTIELNPEYGGALNELAYLEMYLGEADSAIAHLRKYAEVRPKEANASDSLAEALMLAGKLDEAEASFKKALDLDPKMTGAVSGLGFVGLYRGDTEKGLATLIKYRDLPSLAYQEKANGYYEVAWTQHALGKTADALKTVDAWEAEAKKQTDPEVTWWPPIARIELLIEAGRLDEALKQVPPADARIAQSSAPSARKAEWRMFVHTDEAIADARLKKAAEAEQARALVETAAAEVGGNEAKNWAAMARGEALMAKGDAAGAAKEFASCPNGETYCVWERMKAEDKAGLKTQAAATKETLSKERRRRGFMYFVWSKVTPMTMGKK